MNGRTALLIGTALSILGCPLRSRRDPSDDPGPPPQNAPTVTVTGTGAKNEANVLRYANEKKLLDEAAVVSKPDTKVREFPQTGKEIVTLGPGTPVTKIAQYFSTGVLVIFTDPQTGDGSRLMGWVDPAHLSAGAPTTPPVTPLTNTAPHIPPKPLTADGGGAVVVKDAGGVAPPAIADAGNAPVVPPSNVRLVAPIDPGNKCPAGLIVMGPLCRKACASQAQCPTGTFCTAVAGGRACTATK